MLSIAPDALLFYVRGMCGMKWRTTCRGALAQTLLHYKKENNVVEESRLSGYPMHKRQNYMEKAINLYAGREFNPNAPQQNNNWPQTTGSLCCARLSLIKR